MLISFEELKKKCFLKRDLELEIKHFFCADKTMPAALKTRRENSQ